MIFTCFSSNLLYKEYQKQPLNLNTLVIIFIVLLISLGAFSFYFILGGIFLIAFGIGAQIFGFMVLLFSQTAVAIKYDEWEKIVSKPQKGPPYLTGVPHPFLWFIGWVTVVVGLIWQMIGLFIPETGQLLK